MNELETVSLKRITDTLERCNGIRIIFFDSNFRKARAFARPIFDFVEFSKKGTAARHSDEWTLTLHNGSKLTVLPSFRDNLTGVRANQVIVDKSVELSEDDIQTKLLPLVSEREIPIFKQGVYIYDSEL